MATIDEEYAQLVLDVQFQQNITKEALDNARQEYFALNRAVVSRKAIAVIFRGVFILGGFAVSLGLPGNWPRIIGAAITAVGIIDNQWLFNHEILMFKTPARNAYLKLLEVTAHDFSDAFRPFSPIGQRSSGINEKLIRLIDDIKKARSSLFNGTQRIKDALANKELLILNKLAVQPDTAPSRQLEAPKEPADPATSAPYTTKSATALPAAATEGGDVPKGGDSLATKPSPMKPQEGDGS